MKLQLTVHVPHFPHTAALDRAVGAAVASMGPEVVLEAVPLEIDGSEYVRPCLASVSAPGEPHGLLSPGRVSTPWSDSSVCSAGP